MDLNHFIVKIADLNIEVNALSPRTWVMCQHYLSSELPDIQINVSREDIEREIREFGTDTEQINEIYFENLAAYHKMVDAMIPYDIILMHGAVVAVDNKAYMFSAPSGTGKTTHVKKWAKILDKAFIVNGDKPLIKITDTQAIACGSPWCGKEFMGTNSMVPLEAIVLMERGEDNHIEEIPFSRGYPFVLRQTYLPNEADKTIRVLRLLAQLPDKVRLYRFHFNNYKDDCFQVAYDALVRGTES